MLFAIITAIVRVPRAPWGKLLVAIRREQTEADHGDRAVSSTTAELSTVARRQGNQVALDWLREWRATGDEQEHTETWEYLQRALAGDRADEDFPPS